MEQNFTIPAFAEPITALADTPACSAAELKRRFQAPAEELRQAHNALAEAHEALDTKVEGIVTETFGGAIHESMLDGALFDKISAKADGSALNAETAAREALDARLAQAESKISTQATQLAQKCGIYCGAYTGGNGDSQTVSIGFTPKAVLIVMAGYHFNWGSSTEARGALAMQGYPAKMNGQDDSCVCEIVSGGFRVYNGRYSSFEYRLNLSSQKYLFLAFQ